MHFMLFWKRRLALVRMFPEGLRFGMLGTATNAGGPARQGVLEKRWPNLNGKDLMQNRCEVKLKIESVGNAAAQMIQR